MTSYAPNRLWSLWDMLKIYSAIFSRLMVSLFDQEMGLWDLDESEASKPLSPEDKADVVRTVNMAVKMSTELGLDASLVLAQRMLADLNGRYLKRDAGKDIGDLRSRIEDQLQSRLFMFVAPSRTSYYTQPMLFGTDVNDKFSPAIADIEDAGRCLALGQGTSSVLHLMRVMEVGLKALANGLKIPYAPSWESYLHQIQTRIDAKRKTKGIQWKRDEKFYRDVSGDLLTVKQAWRNPTMHIDRRYSVEEGEEIFKAVRALMQRLSTKLAS